MTGTRAVRWRSAALLAAGACFGVVLAVDPPDSKTNPSNSHIETTDATLSSGDYEVRLTDTPPGQYPTVTILTSNSVDDLDPRIAIGSGGDSWVVWWRDESTDSIRYKKRSSPTSSFGSEVLIGSSGESSRHPRIVIHGGAPWVAYELDQSGGTRGLAASGGGDDPDPFSGGRTIVGSTARSGDLELQLVSESGKLWITWLDTGTNVAWTQYNSQNSSWASVSQESYASDTAEAARSRIRSTVLGN